MLLIKILFALFMIVAFGFSLGEAYQYEWFYTQNFYHFFYGYTFGSIPFGYLLTQSIAGKDIRTIGSGNIGATNVLRSGKKGLAILTLVLDALKGLLAVWLSTKLYHPWSEDFLIAFYTIGLSAMLGHLFPIWLNFKGGKGVATALGLLLYFNWPVALASLVTWGLAAAIFHYSSLAALIATFFTPGYAYIASDNSLIGFSFILSVLIFFSHYGNIIRLIHKQEPKIGNNSQSCEPSSTK